MRKVAGIAACETKHEESVGVPRVVLKGLFCEDPGLRSATLPETATSKTGCDVGVRAASVMRCFVHHCRFVGFRSTFISVRQEERVFPVRGVKLKAALV